MITLVTTYYNEPDHLQKYVEASKYFIRNSLIKRLIVVDDGSQKIPAKDVLVKEDNISLFVVDEDLGFNSHGARNLAAKHVETDWIFFADIDVEIPPNTLKDLVENIFRTSVYDSRNNKSKMAEYINEEPCEFILRREFLDNVYYSFITGKRKKQSVNVFCIKQKDFWKSGGYDEEYVGMHHGDTRLFEKINSYMNMKILDSFVHYRRKGRKFVYKRGGITEYDDEKMIIIHPENRPEEKLYTISTPNIREINALVEDRIKHPETWKDMKVCNFKWHQEF
jgi:glycosyltransferase involved in cell wall biosynthesis